MTSKAKSIKQWWESEPWNKKEKLKFFFFDWMSEWALLRNLMNWIAFLFAFSLWVNGAGPAQCSAKRRQTRREEKQFKKSMEQKEVKQVAQLKLRKKVNSINLWNEMEKLSWMSGMTKQSKRRPKQLTLRGKFFILLFAAIQLGRAKEEVRLISSSLFTLFLFLSLLSFWRRCGPTKEKKEKEKLS